MNDFRVSCRPDAPTTQKTFLFVSNKHIPLHNHKNQDTNTSLISNPQNPLQVPPTVLIMSYTSDGQTSESCRAISCHVSPISFSLQKLFSLSAMTSTFLKTIGQLF